MLSQPLSANAGLSVFGRDIGLVLLGIDVVFAAGYFVLQGSTDPKWVVALAVLTLTFEVAYTTVLTELGLTEAVMTPQLFSSSFHWEYAFTLPLRALIQFFAQAYLVYRYRTISKESIIHNILSSLIAALILIETALWMALFPLLTSLHHLHPDLSITQLYSSEFVVFKCVNTLANVLAAIINLGLGLIFAQRMTQVKGDEEHLNPLLRKAIRVMIGTALATGISTTVAALVLALWHIVGFNDEIRLVLDIHPHLYATGFFLSLLSREKIRRDVERSKDVRVSAALAGVDEAMLQASLNRDIAVPRIVQLFASFEEKKSRSPGCSEGNAVDEEKSKPKCGGRGGSPSSLTCPSSSSELLPFSDSSWRNGIDCRTLRLELQENRTGRNASTSPCAQSVQSHGHRFVATQGQEDFCAMLSLPRSAPAAVTGWTLSARALPAGVFGISGGMLDENQSCTPSTGSGITDTEHHDSSPAKLGILAALQTSPPVRNGTDFAISGSASRRWTVTGFAEHDEDERRHPTLPGLLSPSRWKKHRGSSAGLKI